VVRRPLGDIRVEPFAVLHDGREQQQISSAFEFVLQVAGEGIAVDGAGKVARARAVGTLLAAKAKAAGVTKVVFDRAGYRYHGRVQAIAEGARAGGLEF